MVGIPIHVAVSIRLVRQLASNANQLALKRIGLSISRHKLAPEPTLLLFPVVAFGFAKRPHTVMPNVQDQRRRASDAWLGTETQSRDSVQPGLLKAAISVSSF